MKKLFLLGSILLISSISAKNLEPVSYWDMQNISNPKISPNNELVIFLKRHIDKKNDSFVNEIWMMDHLGNNKRFFTKGSSPKWSPDSKRIAYIKVDDNNISQIYIKHLDHQTESMITTIEKGVKDFAWSKDGKYLSFSSFNVYEPDWEIEIPGKVDGQDYSWTKEPNVVTTMHWKSDGRGEYESGENHIYLVNADGGAPIKLSSFGMDYVGDLQWLDGQTLLFSGITLLMI